MMGVLSVSDLFLFHFGRSRGMLEHFRLLLGWFLFRFGFDENIRIDPQHQYWNIDVSCAPRLQVPGELLEVSNSGGHFASEPAHGHNLDSALDVAEIAKNGHLRTDIVHHESILAELNFYSQFILHEVHLAVWSWPFE